MNAKMKTTLLLAAITLSTIVSCATSPATLDPETRRRISAVTLVEPGQQPGREYTIMKEVVGYSCARQLGSTPTVDEAKEALRVEAGKIGAEAVVNVACEATGISMTKNCWKALECRGDAVKWKQ
jgi:hypothetical protein